jgi:alpha-tubulin suppressor-like RCC1 family protein
MPCAEPITWDQSLAVSHDGKTLYGWGSNDLGQLGPEIADNVAVPTRIPVRADGKIVAVSAGYAHSAVLTDKGTVLTFGRANNGQLGKGQVRDDDSEPSPVQHAKVECPTGKL